MLIFRGFLLVFSLAITAYTVAVIGEHGWGLFPVYFNSLGDVDWPGQFNADFAGYLMLSALWVAWRHRFSTLGIGLALVMGFGGAMFFMPYLLVALDIAKGDLKALLLGARVNDDRSKPAS